MSHNIIDGDCWVAYFDILGFKREVNFAEQKGGGLGMLKTYREVLAEIGLYKKFCHAAWFSDSFVFYSDSAESITILAQYFFDYMFLRKIPLRGCLTYGRLYADQKKKIYYGSALIEAYELAEGQDWIGFVLSKKGKGQMKKCRMQNGKICWEALKSHYIEYDVPTADKRISAKNKKKKLPAYKMRFSADRPDAVIQDLYFRFVQMWQQSKYSIENTSGLGKKQKQDSLDKVKRKYRNTGEFLSRVYPQIDESMRIEFLNSP
jgi:hypothetical protein